MKCILHCESRLFPFVLHLFCFFVYLFVCLPHGSHRGRYFIEKEKKNKAKVPQEAAKESEREPDNLQFQSLKPSSFPALEVHETPLSPYDKFPFWVS